MERCPYCFKPLQDGEHCDCWYEESKNARIAEALRPGTIVGAAYQIGGVLGQGGFGITYYGFDLDMEKIVAIKEFFPEGIVTRSGQNLTDPASGRDLAKNFVTVITSSQEVFRKSLDLFYREAKALARLSDLTNVAHAHRIFKENNTAYIVMDFVKGKSLETLVKERGKIPEDELLQLLDPVLGALETVHAEGILHRDIAPDNIMIKYGKPVLLDFGSARVEEDGHHSSLVIGKRGYSSYEQMSGDDQDQRSDLYSIGAVYYYTLSGTVPQSSLQRALNDKVVPLHELVPVVSRTVSSAVMKAMAVNRDDRWENIAEFRKSLEKPVISRPAPGGSADGDGKKSYGNGPKGNRAPSVLLWILLTGLLLAAGYFGYRIYQAHREQIAEQTAAESRILEEKQTEFVRTQEAFYSEQTRSAVPPSTNTPQPTDTPVPTATVTETPTDTPEPTTGTETPADTPEPADDTGSPEIMPEPEILPVSYEGSVHPGDIITFGNYEQDNETGNGPEPVEWQVLTVENGQTLLISKYGLDAKKYTETSDGLTWETCSLRKWLNGEFFSSIFSPEEQTLVTKKVNANPDNPKYGTNGGSDTQDRIFLLSFEEAERYFADNSARQCEATAFAAANGAYVFSGSGKTWWWLRSPGYNVTPAAFVHYDGNISLGGTTVISSSVAVRPAVWLDTGDLIALRDAAASVTGTPIPVEIEAEPIDFDFGPGG